MTMRGIAPGLALMLAMGCTGAERSGDEAAIKARAGAGANLYELPSMRKAVLHREHGSRAMELAYKTRDRFQRKAAFETAFSELKKSEEAFNDALIEAPPRFRTVIDEEVAQVAGLMRQIVRDRETEF